MTFNYTMETDLGDIVPLEITYKVFGAHLPATRLDPEEWPEVEVTMAVHADTGKEINLTSAEMGEVGVEAEGHYQREMEDMEDSQVDYRYEIQRDGEMKVL